MFHDNNNRRMPQNQEWGHEFWNWVSDLTDPSKPSMKSKGGDIANTGVTYNFTYDARENELSVNLQIGGKKEDVEGTLRRARGEIESEISGNWEWKDMNYNDGHGCTYLFGTIEKQWDVQ